MFRSRILIAVLAALSLALAYAAGFFVSEREAAADAKRIRGEVERYFDSDSAKAHAADRGCYQGVVMGTCP